MKVQIQAVQFTADQKLLTFVEERITKLERFFDRIINAEVYLSLNNNGQVKDKITKVILQLPGNQIIVSEKGKLFEESVDKAAESMKRQLKKHKEKMRRK